MNGSAAEDRALRHLQSQGLRPVARNSRFRGGELDLVMLDGAILVVVEVRARSHPGFASAAESVDARKQARLIHATQQFLVAHPEHGERAVRFDVVTFDGAGTLDWIRDAFDAG